MAMAPAIFAAVSRAPPDTLKLDSSVKSGDKFDILQFPIRTESAIRKFKDNTLSFAVSPHADKMQIKDAVQKMYGIQVKKVNTLKRPNGRKEAYIKLDPSYAAADVASKCGLI